MIKIKEAYVSFEVAKLLKERGFWMAVPDWYYVNGKMTHRNSTNFILNDINDIIPVCTQQMAMRWLREKHGLFIGVNFVSEEPFSWKSAFDYTVRKADGDFNKQSDFYKTYEEACEAAIKYCLENLL